MEILRQRGLAPRMVDGVKICSLCKKSLQLSMFSLYSKKSGKLRSRCKDCCSKYYQSNKDRHKKLSRDWFLKSEYNISLDEYNTILKDQNGSCKICKKVCEKTLHVDHCHSTGTIRGLLCSNCNRGIGHLKEDPDILKSAIDYLSK